MLTPRAIRATSELRQTLDDLGRSTRPIIVGPWLSEVGYELLYWIPFLTWVQREYRIAPERVVVLSRGGVASWYAHLANRYLDVFSWIKPDEFRAANAARMLTNGRRRRSVKQWRRSRFDDHLLARAQRKVGPRAAILHPSLMYAMFDFYRPHSPEWQAFSVHRPWVKPAPLEGFPDRYVAARFYTSSICPDTEDTRAYLREWVCETLERSDVVLMHTGHEYDDHREVTLEGLSHPRLHRIHERMTPATNLDVQTRIIAGASAHIGTYGGYSYLAPLLGVPAETRFGSAEKLRKLFHHLELAQRIFGSDRRYGSLSVTAMDARQVACA